MTVPVIRLDRSKPFSECRGDRTPEDPHYKVVFLQGSKVNGENVLLPFDAADLLVPDDGKRAPYAGMDSDGKTVMHQPLYNKAMRDLVAYKIDKMQEAAVAAATGNTEGPAPLVVDDGISGDPADEVNFASWLRGEVQYEWTLLQRAAKKRHSRIFQSKKQMVEDLVCDERVIPEDQVCAELAKHLPPKAA